MMHGQRHKRLIANSYRSHQHRTERQKESIHYTRGKMAPILNHGYLSLRN